MSAHDELIQRLERATETEFPEDYTADILRILCSDALDALKACAEEAEDAEGRARMRWQLACNGFFREPEALCWHPPAPPPQAE